MASDGYNHAGVTGHPSNRFVFDRLGDRVDDLSGRFRAESPSGEHQARIIVFLNGGQEVTVTREDQPIIIERISGDPFVVDSFPE